MFIQLCLAKASSELGEPEVSVKHILHLVIQVVPFENVWPSLSITSIQAGLVLSIPSSVKATGSEAARGSTAILYCHIESRQKKTTKFQISWVPFQHYWYIPKLSCEYAQV